MSWYNESPSANLKAKGHDLNFNKWVSHPQKRHYWGVPNKNLGFCTSEQLEQIDVFSKNVRTQPSFDSDQFYQQKKGKNFIVASRNSDYVHCCTCHNNPKRYISGELCKFCEKFQKAKSASKLNDSSHANTLENPQGGRQIVSEFKSVEDKNIQVSFKLPLIRRHNNKYPSSCEACKDKESDIKRAKQGKRVLEMSPLKVRSELDSLEFSFSSPKKRNKRLQI